MGYCLAAFKKDEKFRKYLFDFVFNTSRGKKKKSSFHINQSIHICMSVAAFLLC